MLKPSTEVGDYSASSIVVNLYEHTVRESGGPERAVGVINQLTFTGQREVRCLTCLLHHWILRDPADLPS